MNLMVILVKNLMLQSMQRIATLMSLILFVTGGRIAILMNQIFMIVPRQMMEMLSRQIQLLMVMLNKMMYPKILFKAYKTKL
jgi:hypothetical protein